MALHRASLGLCAELADCHLCAARSGQDAGSPLAAGHMTRLGVVIALQTSAAAALLSIEKVCGNTQVLAALGGGSRVLPGFQMWASTIEPLPQHGRVSVEALAEVGLAQQVDQRVVDGGGLGEDGGQGECIGRDLRCVSEGGPHGHGSVGTPSSEEADTHCHRQLWRRSVHSCTVQHWGVYEASSCMLEKQYIGALQTFMPLWISSVSQNWDNLLEKQ